MSLLQNSNAISSGGYDINNSLRFRSSASAYLGRTPASAGNRKTWTWSAWVKRGALGARQTLFSDISGTTDSTFIFMGFTTADNLEISAYNVQFRTSTQVFRDPSAWYHIVFVADTNNATAQNRLRIYVNNNEITSFSTNNAVTQNSDLGINQNTAHFIASAASAYLPFDGYLAEVNFIDGQALTPSSFGETDTDTGSWKPKAYTGTYGTNGFYLKFSDIATTSGSNAGLGKDFSGNGNYFNTNNISVTAGTTYDAMIDSPTLTSPNVANYCTLNPLPYYGGYTIISNGNLQFTAGSVGNWMRALATFAVSSGKWYWEVTANNTNSQMHGILTATTQSFYVGATNWVGYDTTGYAYFSDNGTKYNSNSGVSYGATYGAGDIIGIAFDADNGKLYFSKNGTWQASGDPAAGTNAAFTGLTNGPYVPAISNSTFGSTTNVNNINFGQRPFTYTPPTGFVRLNTFNLPDSTIKKGNTVMDATLWTGTATGAGANTITITNQAGFKPDFVWAKGRSIAYAHGLFNSVAGVNRFLVSNTTNAELVNEPDGYVTSFNSNGFTLGNGSNSNLTFNSSPQTYVAWQWQAGQGTTSSNTSGTITSTVSVNATAGFSIVTFTANGVTGATVGHGLGVAPKMMIVKCRSNTQSWPVYHATLGNTKYLMLNTTAAEVANIGMWNNTSPTSTVFTIGDPGFLWTSGFTYVTYCWAEIPGFSAFGSYTGNGSTDGPFVYTGFRPKFILTKSASGAYSWYVEDTTRSTYNAVGATIAPNTSSAEDTAWGTTKRMDILSNGFKIRISSAETNASGATFIYMAFAENPLKNSNAR